MRLTRVITAIGTWIFRLGRLITTSPGRWPRDNFEGPGHVPEKIMAQDREIMEKDQDGLKLRAL